MPKARRLEKVVSLGNAATDATMVLLSKQKWQRTIAIAVQVENLEPSLHPGFYDAFITAMDFPDVNLW